MEIRVLPFAPLLIRQSVRLFLRQRQARQAPRAQTAVRRINAENEPLALILRILVDIADAAVKKRALLLAERRANLVRSRAVTHACTRRIVLALDEYIRDLARIGRNTDFVAIGECIIAHMDVPDHAILVKIWLTESHEHLLLRVAERYTLDGEVLRHQSALRLCRHRQDKKKSEKEHHP